MTAHPLRGVVPAKSVDYVAFVRPEANDGRVGVIDEIGRPCAHASDATACLNLLGALEKGSSGWQTDDAVESVVATVADDVILYQSAPDLVRLLGAIDSAEKAALLARGSGRKLACDISPIAAVSGGYQVTTRRFGCIEVLRVTPAGQIVVDRADMGGEPCPVDAGGFGDTGFVFDSGFVDTGDFDTGATPALDSASVDEGAPDGAPADAGSE